MSFKEYEMSQIGDTHVFGPNLPVPARRRSLNINMPGRALSLTKELTSFTTNLLFWMIQISYFLTTIAFNILCNPVVWFMVKTTFNILSEIFVYLVLGCCSLLISIITHFDEYYTKGKPAMKHVEEELMFKPQESMDFMESEH